MHHETTQHCSYPMDLGVENLMICTKMVKVRWRVPSQTGTTNAFLTLPTVKRATCSTYSLNLYCVECGFGGLATNLNTLDFQLPPARLGPCCPTSGHHCPDASWSGPGLGGACRLLQDIMWPTCPDPDRGYYKIPRFWISSPRSIP